MSPEEQEYLLSTYGTMNPFKIAESRRKEHRARMAERVESYDKVWDDALDKADKLPEDAPAPMAEEVDLGDADPERDPVVQERSVLVIHYVLAYPNEEFALENQRRALLQKFAEDAQYFGFTPVLATVKEMKTRDLTDPGSELYNTPGGQRVRGRLGSGAERGQGTHHAHSEGGGVPLAADREAGEGGQSPADG